MKRVIIISLIFLFYSCEKEKSTLEEILTGEVNKNMFYFELNPPVTPKITWGNCGLGVCFDSIDLYNDGHFDIFIEANFLDYQAFMECCPPPLECDPDNVRFRIFSKDDIKFATYYELWHSYDNQLYYNADTLSEGHRIDTISYWESITELWDAFAPLSNGAWFNVSKDMYIGLRKGNSNNFKYGWILVGAIDDNNSNMWDKNFIFKEYAIEK